MRRDDGSVGSLLATSHVDGRVHIYKFSSHEELAEKQRLGSADLIFQDHFYSANQATFAQNTKSLSGENL